MIELKHVKKDFGTSTPLKDINCVINENDIISVIGPSGAGKSTLLRCINMLGAPTDGDIIVDGEVITAPGCDLTQVRKKIGMVFQSFNLFGNMSVIENVMLPQMDLLKRSKQEAYDKAMEILERVGMENRYRQYPEQLSGGQKQRVAIARTLAMDPKVILFDEPTSALDPAMVGEVQAVIKDLAESRVTMMIVTHDMKFARSICNRVFYLDQGVVYEEGTPEQIFEKPTRERTKSFIRNIKTFRYSCRKEEFDYIEYKQKLSDYMTANEVPASMQSGLDWAVELINTTLRAYAEGSAKFTLLVEYDAETRSLSLIVYANSMGGDTNRTIQNLSSLFERFGGEADISKIDDPDFDFKIILKPKQFHPPQEIL